MEHVAAPSISPLRDYKECFITCRETHIPADLREEFLSDMAAAKFSTGGYNLLENNCNNFSNDFASFLTGKGIPVSFEALICARWLSMARGLELQATAHGVGVVFPQLGMHPPHF